MTGQLERWGPGWDIEPCDTSPTPDPGEQAHTDLHAPRRYIPGDHGRAPGRPTYWQKQRIHTLTIKGDLL